MGQLDTQVVTAMVHLGHKVLACTDSVLSLYCQAILTVLSLFCQAIVSVLSLYYQAIASVLSLALYCQYITLNVSVLQMYC